MVMGEDKEWGGMMDIKILRMIIHGVCFLIFTPVTVNDSRESENPGLNPTAYCIKNTMTY
jgi:hypothetical protein